jgi:hypothetical protein
MSKNSGVTGKTVPQLIRQRFAADRAAARAERTNEQQLALLDQRPGNATRERARLAS